MKRFQFLLSISTCAATPWAPSGSSETSSLVLPSVKPLPNDLVLAAATRVAASATDDQLQIIRRLLGNVLKEPDNEKFRRLKMSNAKIAGAIGGGSFGKELLVALGFVVGPRQEICPLHIVHARLLSLSQRPLECHFVAF
jgi:hypothetical protein